MCGIFCVLRFISKNDTRMNGRKPEPFTQKLLENRGPDASSTQSIQTETFEITFSGFVLWQQGDRPCQQPLLSQNYVLLMNGDIYSKRGAPQQSDTEWLMEQLDKCHSDEDMLALFRDIKGPYSIIFYSKNSHDLYFLRDGIGRQTLLLAREEDGSLIFSSVIAKTDQTVDCIELPPLGIFRFNLSNKLVQLFPWKKSDTSDNFQDHLSLVESIIQQRVECASPVNPTWLNIRSTEIRDFNFETILRDHIRESPKTIFKLLLEKENIASTCRELIDRLTNSIRDRIKATPAFCKECIQSRSRCDHSKVGILFSGGIDCTIIACLTDILLNESSSIDLINVSFEKVSRGNKSNVEADINYDTPDRISARESLSELRSRSDRKWNLIEINVTRKELTQALSERITHLVNPLCTVLDESLGAVLWFGAGGSGICDGMPYSSPSRVLLIGSGADELFGGYTRHRNAFLRIPKDSSSTPYENLENELNFDFDRLPSRNLARDDRVIGDFGITARSPFLEEEFINFVRNLRAHQKCNHALEQGVGDKLILRLCGAQLGLQDVAHLKKRAMQFGSRVADRKQNAKDLSEAFVKLNT